MSAAGVGAAPQLKGICPSHDIVNVRWIEGAHRCQICGEPTNTVTYTGSAAGVGEWITPADVDSASYTNDTDVEFAAALNAIVAHRIAAALAAARAAERQRWVDELSGAMRLTGDDADDAQTHPHVVIPQQVNELANRVLQLQDALAAARAEAAAPSLLTDAQREALEAVLRMPRNTIGDDQRYIDAAWQALPWFGTPNMTGQVQWLLAADARLRGGA